VVSDLFDANPTTFIPVYYHLGTSVAYKPWCTTRFDFYGVTLMPYMWWDGWLDGSYTYADWNADLAARQAVPTDMTIGMSSTILVDQLVVDADVCVEAGGTTKDVRVYFVVILDHYPDDATYYRNAFRQVYTQDVNVPAGDCVHLDHSFTLEALDLGRPEDVGAVVWAQDPLSSGPAEIHQAAYIIGEDTQIFHDGFESGDFSGWSEVVQ